jgi:hypothetical protein
VITGVGSAASSTPGVGSVIVCTNGTQNGLAFSTVSSTAGPILSNFAVLSSVVSTGTGLAFGTGKPSLSNIIVGGMSGGSWTNAISATTGGTAIQSTITGATAAISGSSSWTLVGTNIGGGTVPSATLYAALTSSSALNLYIASTTDMANGGNVTPTLGTSGQPIAYHRIRGTSIGGGTVNSPGSGGSTSQVLSLELVNTTAGAFAFAMNAIFKTSGNPSPGAGARITVTFNWNATEALWVETSRSAAI